MKKPRYTLDTTLGGFRIDVTTKGNITALLRIDALTSSSPTNPLCYQSKQ
jgi:hypothetical protein